jgi:hypothetical protein
MRACEIRLLELFCELTADEMRVTKADLLEWYYVEVEVKLLECVTRQVDVTRNLVQIRFQKLSVVAS